LPPCEHMPGGKYKANKLQKANVDSSSCFFGRVFGRFSARGVQHTTKKTQEILGTATFLASDPPTHHGGLRPFVLGGPLPLVAHDAHLGSRSYRDIDSYITSGLDRGRRGPRRGGGRGNPQKNERQAGTPGRIKTRGTGSRQAPEAVSATAIGVPWGGDAQPALRAQGSEYVGAASVCEIKVVKVQLAPRLYTARICIAALACCTLASHRNDSLNCWVGVRLPTQGHRP
jgi:hypothetical protein